MNNTRHTRQELLECQKEVNAEDDGRPYHFGRCPRCKRLPVGVSVAVAPPSITVDNWTTCPACEVMWLVGQNLMRWPHDYPPPPANLAEAGIVHYGIVESFDGPLLRAG